MKNHFACFWLIICGYRNKLISRKKFIEYWECIQYMETGKKEVK